MNFVKKHYAWISGLFIFLIYLMTLAPSVIQIDAGELAAVQATWGVAHPTGYPLFVLLGYIFIKIPLPFSVIFKANLLAAVWCSLAVVFFMKAAELALEKSGFPCEWKPPKEEPKKKKGKKQIEEPPETEEISPSRWPCILAVLGGGFFLAFSRTFWFQSTSVEVYSLHVFLICLLIYFLLKAYFDERKNKGKYSLGPWLAVALCLALGFSNHLTTLLILPGIALLFFLKEKFSPEALRKGSLMLALFFPVLTALYMLLPFRAAQNPMINWGNVVNFESFMRHFTGRQYNVWMFSSFESAQKQLAYFLKNLPSEFAVIGLILAVAGAFIMFKRANKIFYFIGLCFVITVFYSVNYDIIDIDSYFLLAYIAVTFFAVFGLAGLIDYFIKKKLNLGIQGALLLILIVILFSFNFSRVNQHNNFAYEDYTKLVLESTEENSIILSYQWDLFVSQSYYYQFVENFRRDIVMIDKELLRRSWYYDQIRAQHPDVLSGLEKDVSVFLKELAPFERSEEYNTEKLDLSFKTVLAKIITTNFANREIYIGPEIVFGDMNSGEFPLPEGYSTVPHLFLYKVVKGEEYVQAPPPDFNIRMPKRKNSYIESMERMMVTVLFNRAAYEMRLNNKDRARVYLQKATREFPRFSIPPQLKELLN